MPRYALSTVLGGGLGANHADFAAANIAAFPPLDSFTPGVNTLNPPPEQPGPSDGGVSEAVDVPLASFDVQPGTNFGLHSSVHVVQQTGASSNRVDIIFMGDGYTSSQLATTYMTHVMNYLNYMFAVTPMTDPFSLYRNFFNIYVVDVVSNQSGADDPSAPNGGLYVDTALDASYRWDTVTQRLLYINETDAIAILNNVFAGTDVGQEMLFVTVNATQYGGGGGYFGVYAGGNPSAFEVALHEIGHSFAHLADEYGGPGTYIGGEPSAVNVTINPTGAEWSRWHGYVDPILGVVGAFQGGYYNDFGIWRPTNDSRMRSLNRPFDAIAREAFILQFYQFVNPLDGWDSNTGTRTNLTELNVDTLDPNLILVDWTVNGTLYVDVGEEFLLSESFGWGTFTITARAYDPTPWVRVADRSSLEQSVTWTVVNDYRLVGTAGAETLTGNNNAQTIEGRAGNDILRGQGGNDMLIGGDGIDTAQYAVASTSATWHRNLDGSWTVTTAVDGTDTLVTVEILDFTDRDVFLDRASRTFYGDGTSDILLRRFDGVTAIWTINGALVTGGAPTQWQAGAQWELQNFGDFNGDGRDDFLLRRTDGVTAIWSMNGVAVASAGVTQWQAGNEWVIQGVGDFNGDGRDDFLWRRGDGVTSIWSMDGLNVAAAGVTVWQAGNEWTIQGVGDFNGDGRDDIFWRRTDGVTSVWHMDGANVASAAVTNQQAGTEWAFAGIGDFNGDGRDDVLLRRSDGVMAVWTMNGATVTSASLTSQQAGAAWNVVAIGDYNGDGRDDILLQNGDSSLLAVWIMNGANVVSADLTTAQAGFDWEII